MNKNFLPGEIIGYGKRGPIRLIAGGSPEHDEPIAPTPPVVPPAGPFYTEADLERVRKEEKDKLYDRISKTNTELNSLKDKVRQWESEKDAAARAEQEAAAARAAAEAEEARKKAEETADFKKLLELQNREWKEREDAWNTRLAQIEAEREQERALLEKDRQLAQLQAFIQRRVSEEAENIAPELIDLINGNTPEEVEASILRMKEKTALILNGVSEAQTALQAQMRGVAPSGYGAYGPMEQQTGTKQYTADEIASMPMSEYQQVRPQLLGGSASGNGRGIFG